MGAAPTSQTSITLPITINTNNLFLPIISVNNAADDMIGMGQISNSAIVLKKGSGDTTARTGRWGLISVL